MADSGTTRYSVEEASRRAGVGEAYMRELVTLGLLRPGVNLGFSDGDVRRVVCLQTLNQAGVPLAALADGVANGTIALDFLDDPVYERLAATTDETFSALAVRTGVPIELLGVIRETLGSPLPAPDDYVREHEHSIVPYVQTALRQGFSPAATESFLRVAGDSLRRLAETEGDLWYGEILAPRLAMGLSGHDLMPEGSDRFAELTDEAIRVIFHGQQAHAWLRNVVNAVGRQLAGAGLHPPAERQPAICFLDITGYTRLTQERGDAAAAGLAEQLGRIVQRTSAGHGGKPVKWLGDGVMFYFDDPGRATVAALEMVAAIGAAGLPPAHVGVHSGEVLFRQGDYFGQTVNLAARIADFARPGEVLVSQAVVEAGEPSTVSYSEVGPVELKGVSGTVVLHVARGAS